MIPVYYYLKKPKLNFGKNKIINIAKFYKRLIFFQKIPNFFGSLIDFLPINFFKKKFVFIRANCDHFGPWIYLYLYCLTHKEGLNKFKICLAKRETIEDIWLSYFKIDKLHIIYNPILHFILAPFFFSIKLGHDVNPNIPLFYYLNKEKYKDFKRLKYLDSYVLNNLKLPKIENIYIDEYKDLFSRKFVLLYARSGLWEFSINKSKRNISLDTLNELIKYIGKTHNIFLIGDSYKIYKFNYDYVFTIKSFKTDKLNLPLIYKKAESVIGSPSGATNFPSLLFNKPTLYLSDIPIHHILSTYSFEKDWENYINVNNILIPKSDYWLMIDNDYLAKNGIDILKKMIDVFLENKFIDEDSFDSKNFFILKNKLNAKQSNLEKNGNIYIFSEYKYSF